MKISQITLDKGLQMRAFMDKNTVDDYAERLLEGDTFPPVILFNDGKNNYVGDGHNRIFAHKQAGIEIINADVRPGTRRDALFYALSANARNGQRRTVDDKRKAVMTMLDDMEWSEESDRNIAKACVVSHVFVSKLRKAEGKQPDVINVKGNGTEYKMANRAKKEPNESQAPETSDQEEKIFEMATEIRSMAEELEASERRIAVAALEATPEEKRLASVKLEELAAEVKAVSENNRVLRISRDTYQNECAELKKQVAYCKRRYEKAEKEVELLAKQMKAFKNRAETAEAHLAING